MRTSVFGIALLLFVHAAEVRAVVVDTKVNPSNGHTYYLLSSSTWTNAETEAVTLGGHLATINDETEDHWVWDTFQGLPQSRLLWIGFNDTAVEGTFVWSSGEPVTYTNWQPNEPNNLGNEDYVHMGGYAWNDFGNFANMDLWAMQGVVEVADVPEPSAVVLLGMGAAALFAFTVRRRVQAN